MKTQKKLDNTEKSFLKRGIQRRSHFQRLINWACSMDGKILTAEDRRTRWGGGGTCASATLSAQTSHGFPWV